MVTTFLAAAPMSKFFGAEIRLLHSSARIGPAIGDAPPAIRGAANPPNWLVAKNVPTNLIFSLTMTSRGGKDVRKGVIGFPMNFPQKGVWKCENG